MTTLDDLRKLDKGSRPRQCRICGEPPAATAVFQLRERGASPKTISTVSATVCDKHAVDLYELNERFIAEEAA